MEERITVGLDLGDKKSDFCVLDASGEISERGQVVTTWRGLTRWFSKRSRCLVALEVCIHSPWVSRLLRELGHDVVVAHAAKVPLIYQNVRKGDRVDARSLARLARVDPELLSPVEHRSAAAQEDLQMVRSRETLVKSRTQLINHVRSSVKVHGHRLPPCSAESFAAKVASEIPEALQAALLPILAIIANLTGKIREYEKSIETLAESYPEVAVLRQVSGVGPITALSYVLTLERPERFARSRDVGAYLGMTPKRRQSGASDPHLRISKAGNGYLRRLLVSCAQYILGPFGKDSHLRQWGLAKAEHGGKNAKKRAIVAVARKLAVLLHRLWSTGEVYRPFPQAVEV
jgi:transposase